MCPYRNRKISELEVLFDTNRDDAIAHEHLARELKLRKSKPRVSDLHRHIVQRIAVGFREPTSQVRIPIAPEPTKNKKSVRLLQRTWRFFGL
jgi:hypothetical protein